MKRLVILGLGYSARGVARLAEGEGFSVVGTVRDVGGAPEDGLQRCGFGEAAEVIAGATHVLVSTPPVLDEAGEGHDPALLFVDAVRGARDLRWIGYFSTTGVYGDRAGGEVNEGSAPRPVHARAKARVVAEGAWGAVRPDVAFDVFRLGGIYGPGRSVLDGLRAGTARRVVAPGHCFGRIHREDIARAVMAAMETAAVGRRVFNLVDDLPCPQHLVVEEGARLLGVEPPPARTLEEVWPEMSAMARSFWSDRRVVRSLGTRRALGIAWRYPTYREGLAAVLAEEGK